MQHVDGGLLLLRLLISSTSSCGAVGPPRLLPRLDSGWRFRSLARRWACCDARRRVLHFLPFYTRCETAASALHLRTCCCRFRSALHGWGSTPLRFPSRVAPLTTAARAGAAPGHVCAVQ